MGETLAQPPWAPGGVMARAVLASLHPSPMKLPPPPPQHRPAQPLVLCLCFLARDPIMEYFNWERSQKQQEGEAERKEGHREEKHGGTEAFGRTRRRSLSLGLDCLGSEGQMRELAPRAGAQVQRREEMCGSQGWATGASKQERDCRVPRHPGPIPGWAHMGPQRKVQDGADWLTDDATLGPQHPCFTERETEDRGQAVLLPGPCWGGE